MSTATSFSDPKLGTDRGVRPNNSSRKMIFWLTLTGITAIASSTFAVVYFMIDGRNPIGRPCYCTKMRAFKVDKSKIDHELWAYASLWSLGYPGNIGPRADMMTKFAPPSVLDDLQRTFKRLSLRPTSRIPERCNNFPWKDYHDSFVLVEPKGVPAPVSRIPESVDFMNMDVPPMFPLVDQLFSVDLRPEFQFNDEVMQKAEEIMKPFRDSEKFDMLIPIYLSGIPPDIEQKLSNQTLDLALSHIHMLHSTMDKYRRSASPLFLVLGNSSMRDLPFKGNDTVLIDAPDNVSLAILGSSNDTIFDHGLWATFGALLARSNVNSFAMDKNVLDAARNASLNWTASVTY